MRIRVIKKADDPEDVTRVSLGMGDDPDGVGFVYCVYRGTKEDALLCLKYAASSLEELVGVLGPDEEPEIHPDDGKRYS